MPERDNLSSFKNDAVKDMIAYLKNMQNYISDIVCPYVS
ncbi:hypothetical protein L580_0175 [Serratia fonticola AU-P3(3)]|nr:hypothetical protein L580_0175 [Serratia fonticola AU-P3(3)]